MKEMLRLVISGPKQIVVRCTDYHHLMEKLKQELEGEVIHELRIQKNDGYGKSLSVVKLIAQDNEDTAINMAFRQPLGIVMEHLLLQPEIQSIRALPKVIVFNSLGNAEAVLRKIQSEYQCERATMQQFLDQYESDAGVIVAFLCENCGSSLGFYEDALFIKESYEAVFHYLQIHAPRYLSKSFAPNAWHMVDLRIYDRYEAYELQYRRILKAISALELGYIISETWNREITVFNEPIGTYQLRLLTFLQPSELKKMLIGLEYGQDGRRIVDLDLFWHGKKLSWKDVMDDKETRRRVKESKGFAAKKSFLALASDKEALITYCMEQLLQKLPQADQSVLYDMEKEIIKVAENA